MSDIKDNGLQDVAQQIAPYTRVEVDEETGSHVIKFRVPDPLRDELMLRAKQEQITLRELLTRAANLYLVMDISGRKPGSYYELHEPGEPPQRIIFPFWPFRKRSEQ